MGKANSVVADVVSMPLYVVKLIPSKDTGDPLVIIGGGGGHSRMGIQNGLVSIVMDLNNSYIESLEM
jgi:hypothetical protein